MSEPVPPVEEGISGMDYELPTPGGPEPVTARASLPPEHSRYIDTHLYQRGPLQGVSVVAHDQPDQSGANHWYALYYHQEAVPKRVDIRFQKGPLKEVGVNGITDEALLSIVLDRLRGFQKGPHSCKENACALTKVEEALQWLHWRTRQRVEAGVEGTNQVTIRL